MFDVLEELGIHRAVVTWFDNAIKIGKRSIALGYCEHGKGVAFIAVYYPNRPVTQEFLRVLVIRDVLYDDRGCDDALWCLNLKCTHNKAKTKHFAKYGVKNRKLLEKLHRLVEDAKEKLNLEPQGPVTLSCRKPPLKIKFLNILKE